MCRVTSCRVTSFLTVPFQLSDLALVTRLSQQRKCYVNFTAARITVILEDPALMNDSIVDVREPGCQ